MWETGYKIRDQGAIHFLTFTVVEWIDVFTRKIYRDILLDSIRFCQLNKGLNMHSWCLMSNHLHLIASAQNRNLSDIIRDLKKFTSTKIIAAIEGNRKESRRDWMLPVFSRAGKENARNERVQFWIQDNHPEELYSAKFIEQKTNYTHNNPVAAGIVDHAWEYIYSSARDYYYDSDCGLLKIVRCM